MAQFFERFDDATKSANNLTYAFNTPYAYYDFERDPKRWFTGPLSLPGNLNMETIVIGLMIGAGISFIALPLVLFLYNNFFGANNFGFTFVKPQMPANYAGRKKRQILQELFPSIHPTIENRISALVKQFMAATDKYL